MAPKKPAAVATEEIEEPESISERMQGQGNVFVGIAAGILIVIAAIVGFSKYNSSKAPVVPAVQPVVVADTVKNDTIKKDTVVLGTDATQVADDDTTSVSSNKTKRHGRKYRRHRRRRR